MVPLLIYLFIGAVHAAFVYGMLCAEHNGFAWQPLGMAVRVGVLWPLLSLLIAWSYLARDISVTLRCQRISKRLFGAKL